MLWLGQIFSQIALNILSFVLAIEIYRITSSNTAVSLMMLTFGLPAVFFGVAFGGIVDEFDKRTILIFCNLSRAVILIFYYFFSVYIFMLYLLSVFFSILTQLFIPAEVPSIPQLIEKDDVMTANSLFTVTFYLSLIIGSVSAGPLIKTIGQNNIFLLLSFLMLLASIFIYKMPKISPVKKRRFEFNIMNFVKPITEGLLFIHRHPRIRQSLFLLTFSQALISTLIVLAPGFADKILMLEIEDVSIIVMGPSALGLITGAVIVGFLTNKFLKGSVILTGIIITGINLILLSIVSPNFPRGMIYFVMLNLFLIGFSNSLINIPTATILQQETESHLRGRVYGVLTSLTGGITVIPVLLSGILADLTGTDKSLFTIGILVLIIGLYNLYKRKRFIYIPA